MKHFILCLMLVAAPVLAHEDGGVLISDAPVIVKLDDNVCLSNELIIKTGQRISSCEAKVASYEEDLKKMTPLPPWAAIVITTLALGAGIAIGFGIARTVTPAASGN